VDVKVLSGHAKSWSYHYPVAPAELSLSAFGQQLGFVSDPSSAHVNGPAFSATWVLSTGSPAGPLQRYYHRVTGPARKQGTYPTVGVLSQSGQTMLTTIVTPGGKNQNLALRVYRTRTGRLVRTVRVLRPHGTFYVSPGLTASNDGQYVLLYTWNHQVSRLDLTTGRLVRLPTPASMPVSAAW
jgi:hypothetical protein